MSDEDHVVYDDETHDDVVDDVDPGETGDHYEPPVTAAPPSVSGMSSKQIMLYLQAVVVIVILLVIIIMVLCRPKKKNPKKDEDSDYPAVEQVCEEQKETRSQVTLRKPQASEDATEC